MENKNNNSKLSKIQQEKLALIQNDPVLWAKAYIITYDGALKKYTPWTARWYQAEMLRDKNRKKVYLNGRRTGKCLPGWIKIKDPTNNIEYTIEQLYKFGHANVFSFDTKNSSICVQKSCPVFNNGIKEVFTVKLANGKTIDATGNHPLYKKNKNDNGGQFIEIDELKIGDLIGTTSDFKNIDWSGITSIKSIGYHQTYDLTVPEYHNFVANDIIVHNTETLCVESLYETNTNPEYVFVFVAPYENQIRLIFNRLMELINASPLLKRKLVRTTKNPYWIEFPNNSRIIGFTSGASSNSGAASLRGQRANMIACDEMDYLGDGDFENISMLAAEREDIRMVCSSTPTGRRGQFWKICTDSSCGYSLHHHPSTHNPNWSPQMEAEFRAELTELGYIHEVLAEFGPQDTGVFNKDDLDRAKTFDNYTYNELTQVQQLQLERTGDQPPIMYLPINGKFKRNVFRTMGVDWDKYGASSSLLILDYDTEFKKFRVIKRVEVPKTEYSYDKAVNLIAELNEIYNPSWIYVDRGSGEYQIERLHIIGDENPSSGLKNKVKGFQFKQKIQVPDPVHKTITDEPMKPFMVNQLTMAFERNKIILSPFDDVLHKQLIDYEVERISQSGEPVYTSKNEHFVDALGLAYLAFVLEFPNLTGGIKEIENTTKIEHIDGGFNRERLVQREIAALSSKNFKNPWDNQNYDPTELRGDRPTYYKMPMPKASSNFYRPGGGRNNTSNWGSRSSINGNKGFRSSW